MSDIPVKIIVDLSKPEGERETIVPLTKEEIAQAELDAANALAKQEAREAEEARIAALKISARNKLVAGEPLTAEEAALLVL